MRIAAVARELHVSTGFIRKIERDGKVTPAARDLNGHRRYSDEDVARIRELLFQRPAAPTPLAPQPEETAVAS